MDQLTVSPVLLVVATLRKTEMTVLSLRQWCQQLHRLEMLGREKLCDIVSFIKTKKLASVT